MVSGPPYPRESSLVEVLEAQAEAVYVARVANGGDYNDEILDFLVRPAMVKRASEINAAYSAAGAPPPFDVGFVPYSKSKGAVLPQQGRCCIESIVQRTYEFRDPIGGDEYAKYRYVLHADGHSASWGISGKLKSGSAIVWLESSSSFGSTTTRCLRRI